MKKIFSILMAVLFAGSMYAADVTDTIAMKGFAGITTAGYQNQTKSGVSAKGVDMVAYAYIGSTGQVRGSKTAVAGASVTADDNSKNWSLYNSAAMPGAIKSIKVTQAATGTNIFQNKLYVSLGTATQGDVTAITSAQAQDDGATANEINFTIDASKKYTYFKLLSTEKFTSGSVSDVKVMVTYEKAESSAKTYYLTMTSDWASYTEKFAIYYFKSADNTQNGWSEMMTAVPEEDNTYVGTIPEGYDKLIFVRFKAEATSPRWDEYEEEWYVWSQTVDLTAPTDDKDLFTITTAGTGKDGDGTWSKHGEIVTPAKFYITGDSALVTDAGAPDASWNPAAIKSETDTFTLKNLKAGQEYILKLTLNGTWEGENNIKGYNELTEKTPGLKDISNDHNIGFKLNEAGDVQVIYKDDETPVFKLVGNFVVEIPHYFIAGTMTNWKDEMVELLPLEEKADSLGVALNLKADSLYLYKIVRVQGTDTAWYGLDGDATMEYGNSTGWYIYKSEGEKNQKNVGLQTTKEGDYPVTLVIKEDQLIVSVVIPKPDTKYYAKYADKAGEWNWKLLTEKEGKWLTDTIVYYGGGMNIHSAAEGDGKYFEEIAGVAAKDTAYFSFNPEDSTLVATVVGAYVVPIAEDGYYLVGTFNDWTPSAAYMFVANELKPGEFVLTTTLAVDDEFKVIKSEGGNFTWYPAEGDNFVVMACYAGEKTMYFNPIVQDGWSLLGGHLYMEYTFKPGYYLVGSMTSWLPKEQYWFGDYMVSEEYQLETVLEEGWQIKVAKLEGNGEVYEYFPDGEGTHYTVDAAHAGAVIVYFRNLGYTEWAAFGGYIYIQPKSPSDIENTTVDGAAVKILRDGQILIIKGEKTYNALGILVE